MNLIVHLVDLFSFGEDERSVYSAYRDAWAYRQRSGLLSETVLFDQLTMYNVGYWAEENPETMDALARSWREAKRPRQVRGLLIKRAVRGLLGGAS